MSRAICRPFCGNSRTRTCLQVAMDIRSARRAGEYGQPCRSLNWGWGCRRLEGGKTKREIRNSKFESRRSEIEAQESKIESDESGFGDCYGWCGELRHGRRWRCADTPWEDGGPFRVSERHYGEIECRIYRRSANLVRQGAGCVAGGGPGLGGS